MEWKRKEFQQEMWILDTICPDELRDETYCQSYGANDVEGFLISNFSKASIKQELQWVIVNILGFESRR